MGNEKGYNDDDLLFQNEFESNGSNATNNNNNGDITNNHNLHNNHSNNNNNNESTMNSNNKVGAYYCHLGMKCRRLNVTVDVIIMTGVSMQQQRLLRRQDNNDEASTGIAEYVDAATLGEFCGSTCGKLRWLDGGIVVDDFDADNDKHNTSNNQYHNNGHGGGNGNGNGNDDSDRIAVIGGLVMDEECRCASNNNDGGHNDNVDHLCEIDVAGRVQWLMKEMLQSVIPNQGNDAVFKLRCSEGIRVKSFIPDNGKRMSSPLLFSGKVIHTHGNSTSSS